jgi:MFS family permease
LAPDETTEPAYVAVERPPSKLGALAYPDFRWFWAHGLLQGIARNMREMLTFLLVYELSGSALLLGLTGFFQAVPSIIFGLIGGALADSVDRKKLLIYTQAANVVSGALLATLVLTNNAAVWHLWVFTSFWTAVSVLGRPAQRAYIPRLVPQSQVLNAITWHSSLSQGTLLAGPLAAGFLAALLGIGWAYVAICVVLGAALVSVFFIKAPGLPEGPPRKVSARTIIEGIQFVRMQEVLLAAMVMDLGVMSVGFLRPILPILALDVFEIGTVGLGVLGAAPAVGAVAGSMTLLIVGDFRRKGRVIVLAYASYALAMIVLGLTPWVGLALVALAVTGYMDVMAFTVKQALIQIVAPDQFRGRAASLSSILSVTGNGTGAMEMGALAGAFGAPGALLINSALALSMTGVITLRWMGLWRHES